jgi:hypothetical protein
MVKGRNKHGASEAKLPMKRSELITDPKDMGALAKSLIYTIRAQRVILDADVAQFYGRPTSAVNQQRSRNQYQFPDTYAFQLTKDEWEQLKSQNVISSSHGGRRTLPWAYTEHGFAMLSTRLRGERAAYISRIIIDTFVSYRRGTLPRERTLVGPTAASHRARLQDAIYQQMERLLTTELPTGDTVASELKIITKSAIGRVKALLDTPARKNEKISAEINKLEAETAKLYAEAQKTNAESASIWADVYQKRLNMLAQLREMAAQLERDDVMEILDDSFGSTNNLSRFLLDDEN